MRAREILWLERLPQSGALGAGTGGRKGSAITCVCLRADGGTGGLAGSVGTTESLVPWSVEVPETGWVAEKRFDGVGLVPFCFLVSDKLLRRGLV